MSDAVVWVQADSLTPTNPALLANPGAPALFVFDDADLREQRISLKRVMFIYECLLQLPVTIRRGDVATEVLAFAQEHNAVRIVTTDSVSPRAADICDALRKGMPAGCRLESVPVEPFVPYTGHLDLKRFSRYWSAVRRLALRSE